MKRRHVMATLLLTLPLLGPAWAAAEPAPAAGQSGWRHERFQQKLGLTDAQMQTFRDAWARQREAARPVVQALVRAERDLRHLALGGADDATIRGKATEIEGLQAQLLQLRVSALREIGPTLSEEQRKSLGDMAGWRWHRRHRAPAQPPAQG
jgi:Spy/CpxP family protein refolding chaperone